MKVGEMKAGRQSLKGIKAASVEMRENELLVHLKDGNQSLSWIMRFRGLIAFEDGGVIGKSLEDYSIKDQGSYKEIRLGRKSGGALFRCEYMEGDIRAAGRGEVPDR